MQKRIATLTPLIASKDEVLIASDRGSTLDGCYGNDVLVGGAGDDTLSDSGWYGNDIPQGGKAWKRWREVVANDAGCLLERRVE